MEFLTTADFVALSNPGVRSLQLLSPHNASSARVTITQVTVERGATQIRHAHASSEQIWIALAGAGELLLGEDRRRAFQHGEVVRFADGEVHGFENTGRDPFVYLSVTSPPLDFAYAYERKA